MKPDNMKAEQLITHNHLKTKVCWWVKDISKLSPPSWARCLSRLLRKPLRLGLILGCTDLFVASIAQLAGFIFCTKVLGVAGKIDDYVAFWVMYNILMVLFIYKEGGYGEIKERRSEEELRMLTMGNVMAISLIIVINFILKKDQAASRSIFIMGFILSLFLTMVVHFGLRELLKKAWQYGLARDNLLIVGDSLRNISWFLDHLHIQRYQGFNILGYIAETPSKSIINGLAYLGKFEDLAKIHAENNIDKLLFTMHGYSNTRNQLLKDRLDVCTKLRIPALILSHIVNDYDFNLSIDGYSGIYSVRRKISAYEKPLFKIIKRCIDIILSLLILMLSIPLFLIISACIKFQDGGSIFFKHRLVGKGGKIFNLIKFRTMVFNAEEILNNEPILLEKFLKNYKLENDPRITRIGKWLRNYSLDELPQLINVLKGDMSLVGPRPIKAEELKLFGDFQNERSKIRPGLTGYWQVNGRSTTTYEERVQMDKFYMQKCNIWMDIVILLKTPMVVFRRYGAF